MPLGGKPLDAYLDAYLVLTIWPKRSVKLSSYNGTFLALSTDSTSNCKDYCLTAFFIFYFSTDYMQFLTKSQKLLGRGAPIRGCAAQGYPGL